MVLRDRRVILLSIVLPLLLMPLLIYASHSMNEHRERQLRERDYSYTVTGSQADLVRGLIKQARATGVYDEKSDNGPFKTKEVVVATDASDGINNALTNGDIDLWIVGLNDEEARAHWRDQSTTKTVEDEDKALRRKWERGAKAPLVLLRYRSNRDVSAHACQRVIEGLLAARDEQRDERLRDADIGVAVDDIAAFKEVDLAGAAQTTGSKLGLVLTFFLLMFMFTGGGVVATDIVAGEKERGTLTTLLTTAVDRRDIATAKLLVIATVAFVTTATQVGGVLGYLASGIGPRPEGFVVSMPPLGIVLLLAMCLAMASLVASALLATSARARTYKEAQLYYTPVMLLGMLPALAPVMPGVELRSAIAVVPLANIAVAVREIMVGRYDWPFLAIAWLVTMGVALVIARYAERAMTDEARLTEGQLIEGAREDGRDRFGRHAFVWFAVIWVIALIVNLHFGASLGLRGQILINLIVLFGGGAVIIIRRYGLDAREALSLRPPSVSSLFAVAIAAPAGVVVGTGVYRLLNVFLPVPESVIREFTESMLPDELPIWQMVVLLALLPAVFEEIAFRGLLLHALRRRFRPVVLCLIVGGVFGLFHFSLFRLAPTALLGALLTMTVLLTGSIVPAMLWHFLNNALSVLFDKIDAPIADAPSWLYLLAVVQLGVAIYVFWRGRWPKEIAGADAIKAPHSRE